MRLILYTQRLRTHQLRLIERIAATGKLQIAAETLNISQPAASRILADIETGIDTALFERTPKGMVPTQVGRSFVLHAQSILTAFQNLETDVVARGRGQSGEVRIGAVTGPAVRCLVPAILKVKETSPEIEPTLEVAPSSTLLRSLDQGHFDFVISRMPAEHDSRAYHMLPAHSETVNLVVRADHPLAGQTDLTLAQLADYEWTIQERGSPIRDALEDAFARAEIPMPRFITNTSSLLVTLGLLAQSDTIATLVEEVADLLTDDVQQGQLSSLGLRDPIKIAPYYIIRQRNRQLPRVAERVLNEALRLL